MKNNSININEIPSLCGVYIFKKDNNILYVGKAKNLKNRIKQYLNGSINSYKTPALMEKANQIQTIVCSNEKESLLLEQELIKKNKPYYNILLLDDKKYPYIVIELKPNKLEFKTKFYFKQQNNTYYFGPLPPNYGHKTIRNFLIRECLYDKGIPIKSNDYNFWKEKFEYAKKILSSSNASIIDKLKKQMTIAAENEQYELAKDFRDIINFLSNKNENQSITFKNNKDFDIIAFKKEDDFLFVSINNFRNGSFFMKEDFVLEIKIELYSTITSFINSFYSLRNVPDKIYSNFEIEENDLINDIKIDVPKKGQLHSAIENMLKNIDVEKDRKLLEFKNKQTTNLKIKDFLNQVVKREVNDFIMIDNSNESNTNMVSAIIYYKNLMPFFSNYRKYSINEDIKRKSDVEYMKHAITKYLTNDEEVPDLIIVDGGIAQLNEVKKCIDSLNFSIPVIGLVKNKNHETDHLIDGKGKKILLKDKQVYNFFAKIQTEVDKFAKNIYANKKIHSSLEGFLRTVNGVGPKLEEKLLNHFKTYSNIYNATEEELSKVIPNSVAKKIVEKLKK